MYLNAKFLPFILYFLVSVVGYTQSDAEVYSSRAIHKHYTERDLKAMKNMSPEKFITVKHLFLNSFILETFVCSGCVPFTPGLYDVMQHNHLRETDNRVTLSDSVMGYHITLLSQNELDLMIKLELRDFNVAPIERAAGGAEILRDMPEFVSTGNLAQDVYAHLSRMEAWKTSDPLSYDYLFNRESPYHLIDADEFLLMPQDKQQHILNNFESYVLIPKSDVR